MSKTKIMEFNKRYRKKEYATDVISFPGFTDDYLGDIIICEDSVRDNSISYGIDAGEELSRVIVHGFLHLLGFEDVTPCGRKTMWKKQEELISLLKEEKLLCIL